MKYFLFLFFAFPFLSACQEKTGQTPGIDPETLTGEWLHSFEEDSAGLKVYRPADYEFPPARGREGFEIREDGAFIYRIIAPADGYLTYEGQWALKKGNFLHVRFESEEIRDFVLEIRYAGQDRLEVIED